MSEDLDLKRLFNENLTDDNVEQAFARLVANRLPDGESIAGDQLATQACDTIFALKRHTIDDSKLEASLVDFFYRPTPCHDRGDITPCELGRSMVAIVKALVNDQVFVESYTAQSRRCFG